jgi:hypothetical protein
VAFSIGDWKGSLHADGKKLVNDPLLGKVLGGHKLLSRLGAGAVGVVYRALQVDLDREVALKMLNAEASKLPLAVASFRREAKAAGGLSHPHLVQVYNVGKEEGYHYYTMELAPGGDFEDQLKEKDHLPWREAVSAVKDCATALAYAEEKGLVHRDVKPENLMIGAGGVVKLADLGLAATRGMLDKEAAGGTPHFMAPESVGKGKAQHASDLYSLGCTLFRLLTGETVFEGTGVKEILRSHRDDEAPTLKDRGIDVPKGLEDILASLLAKSIEDRPEHASDVVEELQHLLSGQAGSKKVWMVGLPVIALMAWGAFEAFKTPEKAGGEPKRVIEYRDRGDSSGNEAALKKAKESSNFYEAMAATEGPARVSSLEAFLLNNPEGAFAEQAKEEVQRLVAIAEQAALSSQPTEAELANIKALDDAATEVRAAIDKNEFGKARLMVQAGPLAAETEMLRLATLVDERASQRFSDWEVEHQNLLVNRSWKEAEALRSVFSRSLGETPPPEWTKRFDALNTVAKSRQLQAKEEDFLLARRHFLAGANAPVREAVRRMEFGTAKQLWYQAVKDSGHPGIEKVGTEVGRLFDSAQSGMATFVDRIGTQTETFREAKDQRQAKLLAFTSEGIKLEVQVSGSRVERVDPWALYQTPEQLSALLQFMDPTPGLGSELASVYLILAFDDLANSLSELGKNFNPAQAGLALARVQEWQNSLPSNSAFPKDQLQVFQTASDFCRAVLHENDYLALTRLEELQSTFDLLTVWSTDGACSWGLNP